MRKSMSKQQFNGQKSLSASVSARHSQLRDITLIALFTALISVCSIISITIPPAVPFTLQTLAVFLTGGILGMKRSMLSVLIYILIGSAGLPVFSQFKSGFATLLGPTGGYIIGFIATAFIVGLFRDKLGSRLWVGIVSMLLGLIACYVFGTAWFIIVWNSTNGGMELTKALELCVFPFLIFDGVKIIVAAVVSNRINRIKEIQRIIG